MSQASADPARPERVLDEVLARPEFRAYVEAREPSAGENWLFRLLDFRFGTPDWLDSLLALAFLGLAAFVLAILLRGARRGRGQAVETWGEVGGANVRARRPAREEFQRGRDALAAGDFGAAVTRLFRAIVARLTERGLLLDDESRTNFEHLRDLRKTRESRCFAAAIPPFERVLYGRHAATREDAEATLAAAAPLFPDEGAAS